MCIVFCKSSSTPDERVFVLAANRDEFLARPSAPLGWHPSSPSSAANSSQILSGLDLQSGGTWIGVSLSSSTAVRIAALTNFTEQLSKKDDKRPSRGQLVHDFLDPLVTPPDANVESFLDRVDASKSEYAGFNLLVATISLVDDDAPSVRVGYVSNRNGENGRVVDMSQAAGLSNSTLNDESWPKVRSGKDAFVSVLDSSSPTAMPTNDELADSLFDMLSNAKAVKDRVALRQTVLVKPVFFDPFAPMPSSIPVDSNDDIDDVQDPTSVGPFEQTEGDDDGHWYATRVQTLILVSRSQIRDEKTGQVSTRLSVDTRERDVYKLVDGKPVWSGQQRKVCFSL